MTRPQTDAADPYTDLKRDLAYSYEGMFTAASIARAVEDGRALLEPVSRIPTFLPILVAKQAREALLSAAQAEGRVVQALAERGISLTEAYPKPLTDTVVRAADVIITMGCGDACPVFPGKRYEDWAVADPAGAPIETAREIRDDIQARVTTLLREILP